VEAGGLVGVGRGVGIGVGIVVGTQLVGGLVGGWKPGALSLGGQAVLA
jgi:hypothetical protein